MPFDFKCSNCGCKKSVSRKLLGQKLQCPKCKKSTRTSDVSDVPNQSPVESEKKQPALQGYTQKTKAFGDSPEVRVETAGENRNVSSFSLVLTIEKLLFALTRYFTLFICAISFLSLIVSLVVFGYVFVRPAPSTNVDTGRIISRVKSEKQERRSDDVSGNLAQSEVKHPFRMTRAENRYNYQKINNAFQNVSVPPRLQKIIRPSDRLFSIAFAMEKIKDKQKTVDELDEFLTNHPDLNNSQRDRALTDFLYAKQSLEAQTATYNASRGPAVATGLTATLTVLGTLALFSLVLVLLAIERNTRRT